MGFSKRQRLIILVSVIATAFRSVVEFVEAAWGLFTEKPMVPTIRDWAGVESMPNLSFIVTAAPIVGIVVLIWVLFRYSRTGEAQKPPINGDHALTQDQIAERQLFIARLRSAAMQLEKNTHYNIGGSVTRRFNEFCVTPQVQEVLPMDEMTRWVSRLLDGRFTALAMGCWDSEKRSDALRPSSLSDADIRLEASRIAKSVGEYRQLVVEFLEFIQSMGRLGIIPFWDNAPWPDIFHNLAEDYDELMRLMRELRNATPRDIRSQLPNDEQLSQFPRVAV